ncbi:MAG: Na+/H+ antiporter NhaA [Microbacteriaceae bacterium]|nr:Na+/H+ antiporter NhaA [Microbacteriaceae bacterium]
MSLFRNERVSALLLVVAAVLGLTLANTGFGPSIQAFFGGHADIPWLAVHLSVAHWVTDGLLAIFFFLAAIELKHELAHGELANPRKALVPAVAAVGGVIAPALVFLLLVRQPQLSDGWPIPTATDIAFALGALAIFGRALPSRVRAFLLALAVIDDLIAIVIIALFFTADLQPTPLLLAVPALLVFGWLSRKVRGPWVVAALIALGALTWLLVYLSGIHATVAGVALGLVMAGGSAGRARHAIEPFSNGLVLPLFAFVAALVVIPQVGLAQMSPVFWAIVIALPAGKLVGITGGALIANALGDRRSPTRIPVGDILVVAGLGGIGFTISLLMNELAFAGQHAIAVDGTLGVLVASLLAAIIGSTITVVRARQYRLKPAAGSA